MAGLHVPVELVEDIFSRVPVKSLVRFKAASKYWYSRLSYNVKFANLHLKQQSKINPLLFFQVFPGGTTFRSVNIDTNESRIFEFWVKVEGEVELVGAANGLICVAPRDNRSFFIWNPYTGERKEIYLRTLMQVFGFAYDSHSEDYKVIANRDKVFRIFSLKTNSWKILETNYYLPKIHNGLQFNGALLWSRSTDIIAFDLAKDEFFFIELPDEIKSINQQYYPLVASLWEYQGCLCVSGGKSIWVMKKYRDTKSWVKLSQSLAEIKKPLGISRLGEVVYRAKSIYGYVRSDVQGRMSNDDESQILFVLSPSAFPYTESLICIATLLNPSLIDLFNSRVLKCIWTWEKIDKLREAAAMFGGLRVVKPSVLFGVLCLIFKQNGWACNFTREELRIRMKTEVKILERLQGIKAPLKVGKKGKGKVGKKKGKEL